MPLYASSQFAELKLLHRPPPLLILAETQELLHPPLPNDAFKNGIVAVTLSSAVMEPSAGKRTFLNISVWKLMTLVVNALPRKKEV